MKAVSSEFAYAVRKERYERSFYAFVRAAWQHVDNDPYIDNWHIEAICLHLQAVLEGRINRLLINVPPGSAKSMIANVLFPAWCWTRNPQKRIINTSFSTDQSERDTVKSRRLIMSEWYQGYWPIRLQDDQNQKGKYENTNGGAREVAPYSNMTGKRGNIVIVDDPQSAEQANSKADRASAVRVFFTSLPTRLNNQKRDAIICIMQRLHEEDVAGSILAKNEALGDEHGHFEHLCIPMEYDGNERVTCIGWKDPRTVQGEPMFPALFPRDVIDNFKITLGPIAFAGQFQQVPAPEGDGFLRKDYFHSFGQMPCGAMVNGEPCGHIHNRPANLRYYMASDHAPAGTSTADYNVIRVWGVDEQRNLWLVDSFRRQCTMDVAMGVKSVNGRTVLSGEGALAFIKKYPIRAWFAEADNTWKAIQSQVRTWMLETGTFCTIFPLPTAGNKMTKAQPYQALASMGKVYLPEGVVGETALLEYMLFPNGRNDDQVDADAVLARCMSQQHPATRYTASVEREPDDYRRSLGGGGHEFDTGSFY